MNNKTIYKNLLKKCNKYNTKTVKHDAKNHVKKADNFLNKTNSALGDIETMILTLSPGELENLKADLQKDLQTATGKNKEICLNGLAYIDFYTSCNLTSVFYEVYSKEWDRAQMKFKESDFQPFMMDHQFTGKQKDYITDFLLTVEINLFAENIKNEYNRPQSFPMFASIPNLQFLGLKICGPLSQEDNTYNLSEDDDGRVCNIHGEKCDKDHPYDMTANLKLIDNNIEFQQFNEFLINIFSTMQTRDFKGCFGKYKYKNVQRYVDAMLEHSRKAIEMSKANIRELEEINNILDYEHTHEHNHDETEHQR